MAYNLRNNCQKCPTPWEKAHQRCSKHRKHHSFKSSEFLTEENQSEIRDLTFDEEEDIFSTGNSSIGNYKEENSEKKEVHVFAEKTSSKIRSFFRPIFIGLVGLLSVLFLKADILKFPKGNFVSAGFLYDKIENSVRFFSFSTFKNDKLMNDSSTDMLNEFVESLQNRLQYLELEKQKSSILIETMHKRLLDLSDEQTEMKRKLYVYNDETDGNLKILQNDLLKITSNFLEFDERLSHFSLLSSAEQKRLTSIYEIIANVSTFNCSKCISSLDFGLSNDRNFPTKNEVETLISSAIQLYDADKTGLADFALESSGGSILSTRCTDTYSVWSRTFMIWNIPLFWHRFSPRTVIAPGISPGECWAFRGSYGYLTIKLAGDIRISAFSYEHIPKSIAPDGHIDSAPKKFEVYGLTSEKDEKALFLGQFVYDNDGNSLQYFPVHVSAPPVPIIELKILSNHGSAKFTCLYRFRVHGTRVQS